MRMRKIGLLVSLLAIGSMIAAACGGGSEATPTTAPAGTTPQAKAPTAVPAVATVQATSTPLPPTATPSASGASSAERFAALQGKLVVTNDAIENAKYGGILQITSGYVPADPDPVNGQGGGQFDQNFGGMIEKLAEWNQFKPTECIPDLTEKWSVDSSGKVYTFNMRPGVNWHDGTPVTAEDVVATFEYRKFLWHTFRRGIRVGGIQDPMYLSSRVVDPMTAEVTLKTTTLVFMPIMCSANFYILPKASIDVATKRMKATEKFDGVWNYTDEPMNGTGPFLLDEVKPGQYTKAVKNPNYWRKDPFGRALPYLDGYTLTWIGDTNLRIGAFRTGKLDFMPTYPMTSKRAGEDIAKALGDKVYVIQGVIGLTEGLNMTGRYPLNNQYEFRFGLALIANIWEFGDRVFEGQIELGSIVSPSIFGDAALPEAERYKTLIYNKDRGPALAEAKRLLDKIGIVPGNTTIPMNCRTSSAKGCEAVEMFASQLRDYGFKTTISAATPGATISAADAATKFAWTSGTISVSTVEPGVIINNRFLSKEADWIDVNGNPAAAVKKLRGFVDLSISTPDLAVRHKALHDAQRVLMNEDANAVMYGYWTWYRPCYTYVRGMFNFATMSEGQQNRYIWLDK